MTEDSPARSRWIVQIVKLAAQPSRHRVAVWRELRKIGALSLGQGVWAVPDLPVFAPGLARARELAERADGETVTLQAAGVTADDSARFEAMFTAAREDDWSEFLSDCAKYEAELDKEIHLGKFTLAELEEEEQSLERLRRWHRDVKARDVFGAPSAAAAAERLRHCTDRLHDYTERVFEALHGTAEDTLHGTAEDTLHGTAEDATTEESA
ncbi:Chromate resistance protein ChrB [Rhodococcus sp. NPDC003318]|uniref:Chromate resistance protein ChrB n=1 Tax=Rhodococcus sp. NPDC003318 TaxID=3364503 RepID=UPI00368BB059